LDTAGHEIAALVRDFIASSRPELSARRAG